MVSLPSNNNWGLNKMANLGGSKKVTTSGKVNVGNFKPINGSITVRPGILKPGTGATLKPMEHKGYWGGSKDSCERAINDGRFPAKQDDTVEAEGVIWKVDYSTGVARLIAP